MSAQQDTEDRPMAKSQAEKAAAFEALHKAPGVFVIPNPWDPGSARLLAGLGFKALTTTSAGYARSIGFPDYNAGRENVMAHIRAMAPMVDVPLAADLEDGFGPKPEDCAETIRQGAAAGLVGGSIEDFTGDRGESDLSDRGGGRSHPGGGGGGAETAVQVHAVRAGGELSARPAGSWRHDQADAGLSGSGRRCAVRAGAQHVGRSARDVPLDRPAVQHRARARARRR